MWFWDTGEDWITKGDAARDVKNWRAAARYYRKALKSNPRLAPIWVQYGHALKESGRMLEAEAAYQRSLAISPSVADTHLQLGHLRKLKGNIADAAESYAQAFRRDHGLVDAERELRALGRDADVQKIRDEEILPPSLADQIASHYWWHSIDLGNGIITPGKKSLAQMAAEFARTFGGLSLAGKSVLDVGAWNGGFCVEAARRGATRTVALDHFTWNAPGFRGRETFELVRRVTGLPLEAVDIDLDMPQLSLSHLGLFDVVLFLGVFYHLQDPIAALREVSALAREVLVLETHVERTLSPRPAMIFYPYDELNRDPTNWWGPNKECAVQLLRYNGFRRIDIGNIAGLRKIFRASRE